MKSLLFHDNDYILRKVYVGKVVKTFSNAELKSWQGTEVLEGIFTADVKVEVINCFKGRYGRAYLAEPHQVTAEDDT